MPLAVALLIAAAVVQLTAADAREAVDAARPEVEAIRGLRFRRPVPVSTIGDDEAGRYASGRFERFSSARQLRAQQRTFVLLGLLPEDADIRALYLDVLREQAGGFYDPTRKAFYLLDDMPAALAPALAAHELTHALEDQYYDLDRRIAEVQDDEDRAFARSAVHEGSASVVMMIHMARRTARGQADPEGLAAVGSTEAARAERLGAMPAVLRRPLLGAYVLGASFWMRGDLAGLESGFPVEDAARVMRDGPRSSEQILHPEKFWDASRRDDPIPVAIAGARRALGRGWRREASGVLGELTLGELVGAPSPAGNEPLPVFSSRSWTNDAASGWGGDRCELWTRGADAVVLVASVWDTERDAGEFAAALPVRSGFAWRRRGRAVAIVAGDAGGRLDAVLEALLAAGSAPASLPPERSSPRVEP